MTELEQLRAELQALKENRPYHVHTDVDQGDTWICHSPYCEKLRVYKADFDKDPPKGWR